MRKRSEVFGMRLFKYSGRKYHAVHNEKNRMYLCDCAKDLALLENLGITMLGYRQKHHEHKRNDSILLEISLGI